MRMQLAKLGLLSAAVLLVPVNGANAHAAEVTVVQNLKKFDPGTLKVQSGDTVHFENDDDVKHNIQVSVDDEGTRDLGLQRPGETVSVQFSHPGEYHIHCSIHPKMRLTVQVE